jgi:lipoate-protein ligase B
VGGISFLETDLRSQANTLSNPKAKMGKVRVLDLGFEESYEKIWNLQKETVSQRIAGKTPDTLIIVEHDHVITLGRSSHPENILHKDLPLFEIERGGDVTYHGPGQLVCYPIISLTERGLGVRQYIELLEQCIIRTLEEIGIHDSQGKLGNETGVWIGGKRKVASIGVAVSHWVTYHGFALNVNTDLSYFERINPCGFDASVMTSVARELSVKAYDFADTKARIVKNMANAFHWELSN